MATSKPGRTRAFISYSHADKHYLEVLQQNLKPLLRGSNLEVWDDTKIQPGSQWREEIE
jgi:internalin A